MYLGVMSSLFIHLYCHYFCHYLWYLSIYLSIYVYGPRLSFLLTHQPTLPMGSRGIPMPAQRYNLPTWTWVCPRASSQLYMLGGDQEASLTDAWTTSTGPLNAKEKWLCSKFLMDYWTSHLIPEGDVGHPPEETHFSHFYPQSCSFDHRWGKEQRLTGRSRALPFSSALSLSSQCSKAKAKPLSLNFPREAE